jgi:hypothetical protein
MTATATITASPTKLRDGTWGARVAGPAAEGDTITITTRAGKTWQAEIERVLWTGDGVSICATASIDRPAHQASRPSRRYGPSHGNAAQVAGYSSYCTDNEYCRCFDCAS